MRNNAEKGKNTMEYTAPEVQIIAFDAEDVIADSIPLDDDVF